MRGRFSSAFFAVILVLTAASLIAAQDGKIKIDELITHRLSLTEINKGFDLMHRGESIRGVVVF